MSKINLSQYEFEFAIHSVLAFGDMEEIADRIGKGSGIISQYLNPNDDRVSPLFVSAQILTALIQIDESRGCKALQAFNSFVNRALGGKEICVDSAKRKALTEHHEWVVAEVEQKPLDDRITELEDDINAKQRLLEGMQAERKRELQKDMFRGLEVSTKTRQTVAAMRAK